MCGIVARIGESDDATDELLVGLDNLEYRGYDSAGIAVQNGCDVDVRKRAGDIDDLRNALSTDSPSGSIGIGHTRWSTHGPPTDANAHPHTDCSGRIAIVHNGIIENNGELRRTLRREGHVFESDTDTEVVPHLIESAVADGAPPMEAFRTAIDRIDGSYAVAAVIGGREGVYAARNDSPLVIGSGDSTQYLASDVPAFLEFTDRVTYLEDGDVVRVTPTGFTVTDGHAQSVHRRTETVDWDPQDTGKGGYDHYMLKEINEQPIALGRSVRGRVDSLAEEVELDGFPPGTFDGIERVHLVAMGTSYHAAMYTESLLARRGVPARAFMASEYAMAPPPEENGTLVLAISQSGETADTIAAVRAARAERTTVVTNVVGSSLTRECDDTLLVRAGPEIGVAATKSFSSQVATLSVLCERIRRDVVGTPSADAESFLSALTELPDHVQQVVDGSSAEEIADSFVDSDAYFFIGRGPGHAVALEGALKFKEITYEHAEGFTAAELKHGPLALVTENTPVFSVFNGRDGDTETLGNVKEIRARGGPVVAVASEDAPDLEGDVDHVLPVPATHPDLVGVLANVQLQLVAYHAAKHRGRSIDKPRNLAKSVTV
ncbi:glutamine--fructose-6-phosphate transaminase (isomerizing) [Halorubrum sp. CBA1125]|uniref:glutamine--fructose-6-phosphate transaminase (isomerizing) n=1 Tax=Halorubrum sp. CBA1125 TaxID=2668072 RepID=UPI0012E812E8|nr:glutamine--fructose-6-phosphate transaminase (isomerizing) [Halorubrum sp. CBA1125]MUW13524.1 glutamine--fructose-6-phosphate transaminase (isomerizing) [Halorubrum sp. CBA1125]